MLACPSISYAYPARSPPLPESNELTFDGDLVHMRYASRTRARAGVKSFQFLCKCLN